MLFLFILSFTVAVTLGSGTYDVDDAWRQMNAMTDHTATFSSTISEEVIKPKNKPQLSAIQLRSTDHMQAAASSYGGGGYGGGGYGGGGYGGGGHGGGGYGGGGYGGHGGGYGGGHYGSYLNNSAVALLGFLYLLNLIQDIINQITTTAAGRKKRMVGDSFQDWMSSLSGGGIQSLNYEIAATILPLVSDFTDHADQNKPLVCVQRSLCSANRRLTSNYGQIGKVFAKLSSEAVLDHFRLTHPEGAFKEAATHGRNLSDCYTIYNECKLE